MTSFAFILGVVPLLLGHGAGAEMRHLLGVAVFSGMLGVTLFGIFLTPVFFYVVEWFVEAPLFHSDRAQLLGKVLLYVVGVLTLGLFWIVPWVLGVMLRRRPKGRLLPAVNGRQPAPAGLGADRTNGHGEISVRRDDGHAASASGEKPGHTNGHAVSVAEAAANGIESTRNGDAANAGPEPVKQP